MRIELVFLMMLISISGIAYAMDCATSAYVDSCNKCTFNASGTMNQVCYDYWQSYGKRCIAEKRPMLASAYSNGKCPEVDACAQELKSCKSAVSTGNDQQDCLNPLVGTCFTDADACVAKAENTCDAGLGMTLDEAINWCPFPIFMVFLLAAGLFYARSADA
jgi:hypothetical protein